MFRASLLKDLWYLAPQSALGYLNLLEHFASVSWLDSAKWSNLVTLGQVVMPDEVYFGPHIQKYSQICCTWHTNALLDTVPL